MVARLRGLLAGVAALVIMAALGSSSIVANSDRDRVISLYNIHTKETLSILYKKDGRYIPSALEKVNWLLRDWRRNETTQMDPELIDLLWEIHAELGSKEPIHIISGYRSRNTNDMLRRTVGGQASQSRHILGKAADVQFPDVPLRNLRYSALIHERGGVGYYPTSAIPFVHVDTDRVRAWPRLPRYELALLFPQGRTQHMPADGGPLTREDVQIARAQHKELAAQVAEFRNWRARPKQPFAVADAGGLSRPGQDRQTIAALTPPARNPRLIEPLRPADDPRGIALEARPSSQDRARLTELAALAAIEPRLVSGPVPASRRTSPSASGPRLAAIDSSAGLGAQPLAGAPGKFGWGNGWVAAPAYDEEHPEELSYRPFPIGPLLTATANEPVFAELIHHDVARTIDMLDQTTSVAPLRFRPGEQMAQLMWAQQFRGDPVGLAKLFEAQAGAPIGVQNRHVRTTGQ